MAEPRDSSSPTRWRDHYNSQRTSISRSSTANHHGQSNSAGHRQSHKFGHEDEAAVSPPNAALGDDDEYFTRPSPLEQNYKDSTDEPQTTTGAKSQSRSELNILHSRRTSGSADSYELTEVAAPPPVQRERPGDDHLEYELHAGERTSGEDAAPYRPRTPAEYIPPPKESEPTPRWLTELYTVSYLIFFAIWGTLARLGTQWLTFYPGTPIVTPVIWANFAGSLILGFLSEDQALFRSISPPAPQNGGASNGHQPAYLKAGEDKASHTKRKKTIPLYIGLATGFCGSFTSFSSFARDYFLALSNNLPTPINHPVTQPTPSSSLIQTTVPRNGGYSFQAWLHIVLVTLALSLGGLIAGAQLATFAFRWTPRMHTPFVQRFVDPFIVFLAWGSWLGALLLCIWPPDRSPAVETWRGEALFAVLFAPPGCLIRFYLSLKLNPLVPSFPLGTFAVNMLGTAIEGMCFDIQHVRVGVMGRVGGGRTGCQVLQGVMDGFCGCLTTVSTWVAEINGLKRKHGWIYAAGSVVGGLGLLVVIMGSVRWSVGWSDPVCATGYTGKVRG